ncbi:NAD(P)/FAD-dependent oxidoreductase [Cellulomonas sp. Root137]|uniref:flavin-containing monooxygenase n=1 Tax=Cellulomonas sp. Root137 TaxID=1736459 RepID=UPI0006F38399|nr:NAD(P)-binding domain-containing protein [Cellulomonas sp. Root137]KQY47913.1 portal protein [Cellulomonas sp. Root137]
MNVENVQTVVIGGGQAGLAASHELSARGLPHVVLEGGARVGDSWRHRWDSLRLFTPARYDGLPGRPFPGDPWSLPTKDQLADYLESYAADLAVPVRRGVRVRGVTRSGDGFLVEADEGAWHAQNVVVATGFDRVPRVPAFAADVRPDVVQLDAGSYRAPDQAGPGDVLVVGAGNSGADIALELAATHRTFLSGRHPGQIPWRIEQPLARPLNRLAFWAFRHVLTTGTPIGRRARADVLAHSGPLIRVKSRDLAAAGVQRVPRTTGVSDGLPMLDDGRTLDVSTIVWCTGFDPDHSWIDLPVRDDAGALTHDRGVTSEPGLYFLGLVFQYALASSMIHGVGADAAFVADHLADRVANETTVPVSA